MDTTALRIRVVLASVLAALVWGSPLEGWVDDELETIGTLLKSGAKAQRITRLGEFKKGEWHTLLDVQGPGAITHIWITFPPDDVNRGRQTLLRIFWDDEKEPSVVAPLTDFFGIPFGFTGKEMNFASHYLAVTPRNGLNCYFTMPFAKRARIEMLPEQEGYEGQFYCQIDYQTFDRELPEAYRAQRFHAQYRFENPCEAYGRNYLALDATGTGALLGVSVGITINEPQADWFVHGGGDMVTIDGESDPTILHGIGLEDYFGQSWGVAKAGASDIGASYAENNKRYAIYRFYVRDPIVFHSSLRLVLGAMANEYTSVAYWYQQEPHRPFFQVPGAVRRLPGAIAKYGTYDIDAPDAPEWKLLAPIALSNENPFSKEAAFEAKETGQESFTYVMPEEPPGLPGGHEMAVAWRPMKACHDFLDFNVIARPAVGSVRLRGNVVGYALRYIESPEEREMKVRFGFDDDAVVRVNDKVVYSGSHTNGFASELLKIHLHKGSNRILVKLSNYDNTNWKSWAFSFHID